MQKGYLNVRITGNIDYGLRKQLRHATYYFANKLISKSVLETLHLHIKYAKLSKVDGMCEDVDDYDPARYFKITLTPRKNKVTVFSTLAHEMVHIKQMVNNTLLCDQKNDNVMIWKRKKYNEKLIAYDKLPWEVEAYALEPMLFDDYVNTHYLMDYFYK